MTPEAARAIADTWKYPPPYDFYDATADPEDHHEFVTPELWPAIFWQARDGGQLVGFFSAEPTDAGNGQEISLGLRPDLTGAGRGRAFLRAGLDVLVERTAPRRIVLQVAAFNRRAITVYEAVGFQATRQYLQPTNGGLHDFVEMVLYILPR